MSNPEPAPRGTRLSRRMIDVLRHAEAGRPLDTGCRGRSEYGGLTGTLAALRQRGLLCSMERITDAGRQALAEVQKGGGHG